jgi:hypothetical protein
MFDAEYFSKVGKNQSKDFKLGVYDYVLNSMLHQADLFKVFAGDGMQKTNKLEKWAQKILKLMNNTFFKTIE